jgi:hypothetical protein
VADRLGPLPAMCLVAVLSRASTLAQIARFAAGCDPASARALGLPGTVPAATALGRLLARLDGDAFDDAVGAYLTLLAGDASTPKISSGPDANRPR